VDKSKPMMAVIIVLLLALIGTVVGVSFYMMTFLRNVQLGENSAQRPGNQVVWNLTPDQLQEIRLADPIRTNLAVGLDGRATHMALVGISINIDMTDKRESQRFYDMMTTKESTIRDICLGIIRQMTFEEINRIDSQETMKKEILDALRMTFESNLIYGVDITEIISS